MHLLKWVCFDSYSLQSVKNCWNCTFHMIEHPCERYVKYALCVCVCVGVWVCTCVCLPAVDLEGRRGYFLYFFFFLSRLHVSPRNVYRKQTRFLRLAREPSYCCLPSVADWWRRGAWSRSERQETSVPGSQIFTSSCDWRTGTLKRWGDVCLDWHIKCV